MILRIVEDSYDEQIVLRLIGRIESEHLHDLEVQIASQTRRIVLDLSEIKLVNHAAVRFLRLSEEKGVELRNCPAYVREWIRLERRARSCEALSPKRGIAFRCGTKPAISTKPMKCLGEDLT